MSYEIRFYVKFLQWQILQSIFMFYFANNFIIFIFRRDWKISFGFEMKEKMRNTSKLLTIHFVSVFSLSLRMSFLLKYTKQNRKEKKTIHFWLISLLSFFKWRVNIKYMYGHRLVKNPSDGSIIFPFSYWQKANMKLLLVTFYHKIFMTWRRF